MKKVVINCSESYCFGIPRQKMLEGVLAEPYVDLHPGDALTTVVGHADYNTAVFEVEMTVMKREETIDGTIIYGCEVTKENAEYALRV